MLKIQVWNRGDEYYGVNYPKEGFDKEQFLKDREDDYHTLSWDSIDMIMPVDDMWISVEIDGAEVLEQQEINDSVTKEHVGDAQPWRELAGASEDKVAVLWAHDVMVTVSSIWENVDEFDISKLRIYTSTLPPLDSDDEETIVFAGLAYGDDDPDDEEFESAPKTGYWGPVIV